MSTIKNAKRNSKSANSVLKYLGLQLLESSTTRILSMPTVMAFSAGMALGAGGGLLFAPQSGRKTRKMIGTWFKKAPSAKNNKIDGVIEMADLEIRDLARPSPRKSNDRHPLAGPRAGDKNAEA